MVPNVEAMSSDGNPVFTPRQWPGREIRADHETRYKVAVTVTTPSALSGNKLRGSAGNQAWRKIIEQDTNNQPETKIFIRTYV